MSFVGCLSPSQNAAEENTAKPTKSANIVIVSADLQSAEISSDETSYTYPDTAIFEERSLTFTLTNTGDVPAKITSAPQLTDPFSYTAGSFPGANGTCKKIIYPQEECKISVDFSPNEIGKMHTTYRLIYNNGKLSRTFEKTFIGTGYSVPEITAVSPAFGPAAGGNTLTISGTQIFTGATVKVGGETCIVRTYSTNQLTCELPSHALGTVDVTVTNSDGGTHTLSSSYAYVPAPTVTSISPNAGALAGSTAITVTGSGFYSGLTATLGGVACSNVSVSSHTSFTCLTAAHATGAVNLVVVNTDNQIGTGINLYTYQGAPTVTSVNPTAGALAGGTSITITGTGFVSGATVTVGGVTCTSPNVTNSTTMTCTTGAHAAGATSIIVTNADTQSGTGTNLYTYQPAPTITSVGPSRIYITGRSITLTGTAYLAGATVSVNGSACTTPVVNSATSLTCTVGANATGTYSIVVTNSDNQTGTLSNGLTVADNDVWIPTSTTGAPATNMRASMIWTGSKAIVFGGVNSWNAASFYDPITDSWSSATTTNAPGTGTHKHAAVWTGSKMIIFSYSQGKIYDPTANSWSNMSTVNSPAYRGMTMASVAWTGSKMMIWGGQTSSGVALNTGGFYDPETDTWTQMTTTGAPPVTSYPLALWTGSKVFVYHNEYFNSTNGYGAIYDPASDSWSSITTTNAPQGTGIGAWSGKYASTYSKVYGGGRYNPETDSWTVIPTTNAPSDSNAEGTVVWTGSRMAYWGGPAQNDGSLYDPLTNTWTKMTTIGAPEGRYEHAAIWTGSRMMVFGGNGVPNTGGMYIPPNDSAANTWTAMTTTGAPSVRAFSANIWIGSRLIVWGGKNAANTTYPNDGGLYDPITNSWSTMTTTGAPDGREIFASVWTGSKLLIWGGNLNGASYMNTGASYDPSTDTWSAMTTTNAPEQRNWAVGFWTGSKFLVWGGWGGVSASPISSGGLYDPSTNIWTATTTSGAPPGTWSGSGSWTGSQMIVWGGSGVNTGGIYTPQTNSWTLMTTTGAPVGRHGASSIWTGNKLIIWGGYTSTIVNDGAIYNPTSNTWNTITTTNAPSSRRNHYHIWTGGRMLVWGGFSDSVNTYWNTGGLYNPETDSWSATSTVSAPSRRGHQGTDSVAWTGGKLIIWGGDIGAAGVNTGAIYTP